MTFSQNKYHIRCEWGLHGSELLSQSCDAVIIVDVLSFSTAVAIAVNNGCLVYPYRYHDESRIAFAEANNAILAGPKSSQGYSLSPSSLLASQSEERIVLPSPNGATISLSTGGTPTYAGSLRNAKAVAYTARQHGKNIGIIPCGERWRADGLLRPAIEDFIGAGAIIHYLSGDKSVEAKLAENTFLSAKENLFETIKQCSSGRELSELQFVKDIRLASEMNVSNCAPRLLEKAYQNVISKNNAVKFRYTENKP